MSLALITHSMTLLSTSCETSTRCPDKYFASNSPWYVWDIVMLKAVRSWGVHTWQGQKQDMSDQYKDAVAHNKTYSQSQRHFKTRLTPHKRRTAFSVSSGHQHYSRRPFLASKTIVPHTRDTTKDIFISSQLGCKKIRLLRRRDVLMLCFVMFCGCNCRPYSISLSQ